MADAELIAEMAQASEVRKNDKRQLVETTYRSQLEALLAEVDGLRDGGDDKRSALLFRKQQIILLRNLIRRKGKLEIEILKHAYELSAAHDACREEMNAAIVGRMVDINDAMKEIRGTAGNESDQAMVDGPADVGKEAAKKQNSEDGDAKATATKAHEWIVEVPNDGQVERAVRMARLGKRV